MARTTTQGHTRQGGERGTIAAVSKLMAKGSFDPTSSSQIALFTLPNGAIPLEVTSLGGATGGTNPTVDIGTSGDPDGFADELDADAVAFADSGDLTGIELTADTIVFGKVGASAATGGTVTVIQSYIMSDDGKR